MGAEARALTDLAVSVADGTSIDWAAVEASLGPEEQRLVRHLQLVSTVAELYRSLPADSGERENDGSEPQGPRWGPLVMMGSLGKGTTAEVFRAWDVTLHREVAVKLFPPGDGGTRSHPHVLSEARRLARVRHPNVATVYGAERHGDRVGFWMELVDGASLDELLKRQGPFGAREAALIGCEIASALAAVHKAGLLHRDVKAQNVLREEGGRIVLTDFGTGEEVNAPGPARMAGTPMYLAPEILRGKPASVQSDLYSLGVLLFYLLTGKFPFQATTMVDLARGHAEGLRLRLRDVRPELPPALGAVIEKALAEAPADRFATAGVFEEALRRTLDVGVIVEPPAAERSTVRRGPAAVVSLLLAACIISVVSWLAIPNLTRRTARGPVSQSIAVLPLVDLTQGAGPPHLSEALTDELISVLGQLHGLRVTSRTSVAAFKDGSGRVRDIAKQLGVTSVLEGTVAVSTAAPGFATRVRVNARLITAGSDTQIWSGTFERALGDSLALQADIARTIAREVLVAVSPAEIAQLQRRESTTAETEAAYFEGLHFLNQYGAANATRALEAFERAARLDGRYPNSYVGLARSYIRLGVDGAITQAEARAKALAATTRAMELDDQSAEAHAATGDLQFYYDWNWKGAEQSYGRAVQLNPSSSWARQQFARYLAAMGRLGEAVEQARRATAVDPLSLDAAQTYALVLYFDRREHEAANVLERALEIDSKSAGTRVILSRVRETQNRFEDALKEAQQALAIAEHPGVRAQAAREMALVGDETGARAELEAATRGQLRSRPDSRAYAVLALGDADGALSLLEEAEANRDPSILWLTVDPRVDALRTHPRFTSLLRRMDLPSSLDGGAPRH